MPLTAANRFLRLSVALTVWYDGGMATDQEPDHSASDETAPDEDETRRRFRAALELKHKRRHVSAEAVVRDGSEKSHGAQGPTKGRTFRRKSV
jgi:Family of unknown function (DUF5302)